MTAIVEKVKSKKSHIVMFSSIAIALYGYDQGMMSLINTNRDYLRTMGLAEESPMVGVIVSVYYLGCTVGAVIASKYSDMRGRKAGIFACLATTVLGNLLMFLSGLGFTKGAQAMMLLGRIVLGLGVGGIDMVVPIYSSELASAKARGRALAQEFQMNIFGLLMAFSINLGVTIALGKDNQWAWRTPIVVMQVFPLLLLAVIEQLPESPRWFVAKDRKDDARTALESMHTPAEAKSMVDELLVAREEESGHSVGYKDMLLPSGSHFHPTILVVMCQINQALTGYGAVSVYGPQIFELLGFDVRASEYITLGNYLFYFFTMTFSWMLIDHVGRRPLMIWGAFGISLGFAALTLLGGLALNSENLHIPSLPVAIPGTLVLYAATAIFGIGWLPTVWLIPTEIYPTSARAQGSAVSVIIWGLANFAVTLLTPIGFNNLSYWLFLVFAVTNEFAGWWTWVYTPESGGRSFEENQRFFTEAKDHQTWKVRHVSGGSFCHMPPKRAKSMVDPESAPLLGGGALQ
ncbi:general substrate transporter [Xylona heveae TC161]|uniref:General substrate transporter n=1 Tax=Xylona heveae (strain CBS 132557 / TC161) TaxID=1328760 RepID=A0A165JR21_XYLHT|nr:general substrate transporter [Xylona heveae TC161]KZF26529.1 general substrate transporter [Xylona heveae TC161]